MKGKGVGRGVEGRVEGQVTHVQSTGLMASRCLLQREAAQGKLQIDPAGARRNMNGNRGLSLRCPTRAQAGNGAGGEHGAWVAAGGGASEGVRSRYKNMSDDSSPHGTLKYSAGQEQRCQKIAILREIPDINKNEKQSMGFKGRGGANAEAAPLHESVTKSDEEVCDEFRQKAEAVACLCMSLSKTAATMLMSSRTRPMSEKEKSRVSSNSYTKTPAAIIKVDVSRRGIVPATCNTAVRSHIERSWERKEAGFTVGRGIAVEAGGKGVAERGWRRNASGGGGGGQVPRAFRAISESSPGGVRELSRKCPRGVWAVGGRGDAQHRISADAVVLTGGVGWGGIPRKGFSHQGLAADAITSQRSETRPAPDSA